MPRKKRKSNPNHVIAEVWRLGNLVQYSLWREGEQQVKSEPDVPGIALENLYLELEKKLYED